MRKTAIITDSNSGILPDEANALDIIVLPMPFTIDEQTYFENITLDNKGFYEFLAQDADVKTSQPTPEAITELWDETLKNYDDIVHIPMSSGLSGSCQTALLLAQDYEDRVQVVNNQRISITQRQSVIDAIKLVEEGKNAAQVKQILEEDKFNSSIYIMVDTLKYLKKGGRLTPAVAAIGTLLRIKPVLQIQGEKLDAFAMARTLNHAKTIIKNQIKKDIETRFGGLGKEGSCHIAIAHSNNLKEAEIFRDELAEFLPGYGEIVISELSLSVSCHIGPGSLAAAVCKTL